MTNDLTRELTELNKKAIKSQAATVGKASKATGPKNFFQCVVFYKELVPKRNFLDKPFYVEKQYPSPEIFMREVDVATFAPFFVKRLIEIGMVGKEVVLPDKSIDPALVTITVAKLVASEMERIDPEEAGNG